MQPNDNPATNSGENPTTDTGNNATEAGKFVLNNHVSLNPLPPADGSGSSPTPAPNDLAGPQVMPVVNEPAAATAQPQPTPSQPIVDVQPSSVNAASVAPAVAPPGQTAPVDVSGGNNTQPTAVPGGVVEPVVVGGQTPPAVGSNVSTQAPVTASKKKTSKLKLLIVAIVVLVLAGGGAVGFALWKKSQNSPSAIFKDALNNSLSQTKFEADLTSQGGTAKELVDMSNPNQPVLDSTINLSFLGVSVNFNTYSNTKNSFFKYSTTASGQSSSQLAGENKWTQVETNGNYVPGLSPQYTQLIDPYVMILSLWISGNFSASQRAELVNYALSNNVYKYNVGAVENGVIGGQQVLQYNVTINNTQLTNLVKKAAQLLGLSSSQLSDVTSDLSLPSPDTATIYVYRSSKQIAKAVFHDSSNGDSTYTYSFGSLVQIPAMPQSQQSYTQLQTVLDSLGSLNGN